MGSGTIPKKVVVIFNMGAGFTDAAIFTTYDGRLQIRAMAGNSFGGEDLLQNIMQYLLNSVKSPFPNNAIDKIKRMGLLRVVTQDAIHKLSFEANVLIDVELGNGLNICKDISREEFEQVNSKVFEKCEYLLKQCLQDAKIEVEEVSDVILVGGCSHIPKIRNLVMQICKKEALYEGINPLEAAVSSAALEGAVASGIGDLSGSLDLLSIQVTPHAIGVRADGGNFIPIIPKTTTIPVCREVYSTTIEDNQSEALIVVYEGEGSKPEENHLMGYFKSIGIPPAQKGVPKIIICMDIDASNVLRVLARAKLHGDEHRTPIMEMKMPTVDDGHHWCVEALYRKYGTSMDLVTLRK